MLAIMVLVGIVYGSTLRAGHPWGGDFSQYIHHAKNLVEGRAYHQTGYIYNPCYATLGPETFPPVFPLILVPSYYVFGFNLTPMKYSVILFFLLALWCVYLTFRDELSFPYLITALSLLAFHPYFWEMKDEILSDIPFLCFVYLGLFLIQKTYQSTRAPRKISTLCLGLTIYSAYGTRSLGLILLVSLLVCDVIQRRRISAFAVTTSLITGILIVLQALFFHSDRSYIDQFMQINLQSSLQNAVLYTKRLSLFWNNGYSHSARHVLFTVTTIAACFAYGIRVKKTLGILEIFSVFYIAAIIIFPFGQMRYVIPLLPLYVFYISWAIQYLHHSLGTPRAAKWSLAALLVAAFAVYAAQYSTMDYGPIREGVAKKENVELFAYIKAHTDQNDVFFFRKPRVLALFTGRKASYSHDVHSDAELWDFLRKIEAAYFIIGTLDTAQVADFVERQQEAFELVYSNADVHVYKIL
ncbi:hypothetical protein CSB45_02545 [candidate division KSB3 bacterium]|uniref:Glycosyltransferase RgtA/B/C/D-like domain-containing protein n=1 Tax=candidate division KSB3 bacterium TaxID=2044937 RepID=A0A2G6EAW4_9BACT|nr:MAG: hypothetical protein CSB45_02545 [candidate division KSB3 bacterium]PIE30959.1 MAG: hypothetical protein CSA57_01160 [candidate division KSB3 bacterium]